MADPLEQPPASSRLRPLIFLIALLLIGSAVFWYVRHQPRPGSDVELRSAKLEKGSITASVSATGTLEAISTVTVGSQVSGPVKQVLVDFNDQVHPGQTLCVLDPSAFEANLNEAEAGLEAALAALESAAAKVANARAAIAGSQTQVEVSRSAWNQVRSQLDNGRANINSARATVESGKATMDNALLSYKRFEQLYANNLVAASERDQARTTYQVAGATYRSSLASLEAVKATLRQGEAQLVGAKNSVAAAEARLQADIASASAAQADVMSARARVRQAEASVQKARVDLNRTVIRSPVAGTVIDRKIEPGQTVAASFTAPELFRIARDLRQMQVKADVSEADVGRVSLGQKVTFTVDAYPDEKFKGKVTQVRSAPAVAAAGTQQQAVVVYGVLISAPNPKQLLKPGMTATVSISAEELKDVVMVPEEALRFLPPNPPDPEEEKKKREKADKKKTPTVKGGRPGVVWVPGPDGPERRDIIVGVSDGEYSQLLDGDLKAGDSVYTKILDEDKLKRKKMRISL